MNALTSTPRITHEQFVQAVANLAISKLSSTEQAICRSCKLTYGAGPDGTRGVTYFDRWGRIDSKAPFVAINALHQESIVQLAGTTIHELGHVLAGWQAGHGKEWKDACEKLGLRRILAAGTNYKWAMFAKDLREQIVLLPRPDDGSPIDLLASYRHNGRPVAMKPCTQGIGTRGGKSRGVGSGSRLRKYVCECEPAVIIRASRDNLNCTCNECSALFHRV